MKTNLKKLIIAGSSIAALAIPAFAYAEIQCPSGWSKEMHGVAEVCVAQNQNQNQAQVQNNNQNQNVNQNVVATGGSSSSSSSSSSNITINNPQPSATPHTVYVQEAPRVVYQTPTYVKSLPATGLPEAAAAASLALPIAGFALRKYAFKKQTNRDSNSPHSLWLSKNSN